MKEITLSKIGNASIGLLSEADMGDVLALQNMARMALPEAKKDFVKPRGERYFINFLTRMTGLMIGIRSEGKLLAQMAMTEPMEMREAIGLRFITNSDAPFHHAAMTDHVVVFKSIATDPWRGENLAFDLISFALEQPMARGASHLFAQVATGNRNIWSALVHHDFAVVGAAHDPKDNLPRFIFQKPQFGFDFAPEVIADEVDPAHDFTAISNLTRKQALVGVCENPAADKLTFLRNREILHLMPTVAKIKAGNNF